ncbi:MAG TPA: sulfotransferase [Tepidisphaeraceae bacterium]|jgi:Tfp pilus assembly protein PilF
MGARQEGKNPNPVQVVPGPALRALARGWELYRRGQFRAALQQFRGALSLAPDESQFHCAIAAAAERLGEADVVERHLIEAVRLTPDDAHAHSSLGMYFRNGGRLDLALAHTARALELRPDNREIITFRAIVLRAAGDPAAAWELARPLLEDGGVPAERWLAHLFARLAPRLGREEAALAYVRRAMEVPGLPDGADGRAMLHYVEASLLERLGRYDEAFAQATRGNQAIRGSARPYDPLAHSRFVSQLIDCFTRARLNALPRATHGSRRPVFIVGMPRSGTSLVEQILASHPQVFGAGELNLIGRTVVAAPTAAWSDGDPYPPCLDNLTPRDADRLAADYLSAIGSRNLDATYVTDKMPYNFLNLGLIELLFPGCRVIHCTRGALDTCVSCYMTSFVQENAFKFDLAHLGAYYRDYRRIMEHWRKVGSLAMLDVRYEDVVLDTEGQTRRLLDFLELPFNDRCLRYYENPRQVGTASEDQVRRPVYHSSIGRWKNYERHLGRLLAAIAGAAASGSGDSRAAG